MIGQFDQFLAGACGVFAGALGYWLAQKLLLRQPRASSGQTNSAGNETPAIQAAAHAEAYRWAEPEQLLCQLQECLQQLEPETLSTKTAQSNRQGQLALRQLQKWLVREQQTARTTKQGDTAAALQRREAEDELVLKWLHDHPTSVPTPRCEAPKPAEAHPELALTQIASELLPFNPIAVRLIGKSAEPDMTAAVERIEKLLASVDPPETMGTLPAGTLLTAAPTIRDPHGRLNSQDQEPQRRRSDQAIIYDALLRRCLGDDDFAWRMLNKFPTRCRTELDSLATELRRRAWTAATRRISQLRGMAANIAADNLREALANLETVCRMQSATRADQLFEAVHGEFQQILDFLARGDGVCRLEHQTIAENQPLSRWPAGYLTPDEQTSPSNSDHPSATVTS